MQTVRERSQSHHAERRRRRVLHVDQPLSTAALLPSQRRAAQGRTALDQQPPVEHWLRSLSHLMPRVGGDD
jgi:hypothetical protein